MIRDDDEYRHWTSVDLWSDDLRTCVADSGGLTEEEVTEESAEANEARVDRARFTRPEARLGVDVPRPLDYASRAEEEAELRSHLSSPAAADFQYWELRLACSFAAAEGESFERANLRMHFRSSPQTGVPVAWSMAPDERLAPGTATWHYKVGSTSSS